MQANVAATRSRDITSVHCCTLMIYIVVRFTCPVCCVGGSGHVVASRWMRVQSWSRRSASVVSVLSGGLSEL